MTGAEYAIYWAIAGAAAAGAGTYMSYQGQKQAAANEEAVGEHNAAVAKANAQAQEQAALYEASQKRRESKIRLASLRNDLTGLQPQGSPLLVLSDQAMQFRMDEIVTLRNRITERDMSINQSKSLLTESKARASAYRTGAGATLLQGASHVSGIMMDYNLNKPKKVT